MLINQEENYKPHTVQLLLAVAQQSAISAEVCTVFALSCRCVVVILQWFGHTGRVLSLPFCQEEVDCLNVLQQCRVPTMFSQSFDNNIAPCQVCCIIPLDNMLHTKCRYKAICQPCVLRLYCPSWKYVLRSTRVQRR